MEQSERCLWRLQTIAALTWQGYVACLVPLALGLYAKDFDTHSTMEQTQTASKEATAAAIASANTVK